MLRKWTRYWDTILKNATNPLRRGYAVDVVDTDRFAATSDKVFQDGAGESGYIGGCSYFLLSFGVSSGADRYTALHSLGLLKASSPLRDVSEKYMCRYTRKYLCGFMSGICKWAIYVRVGTLIAKRAGNEIWSGRWYIGVSVWGADEFMVNVKIFVNNFAILKSITYKKFRY